MEKFTGRKVWIPAFDSKWQKEVYDLAEYPDFRTNNGRGEGMISPVSGQGKITVTRASEPGRDPLCGQWVTRLEEAKIVIHGQDLHVDRVIRFKNTDKAIVFYSDKRLHINKSTSEIKQNSDRASP